MYKIFSYLLLCVGILLILFALHAAYQVVSGGQPVPATVAFADLEIQTKAGPLLIPAASLNTVANISLFMLFMFFLVLAGSKIAGLGCQLLKNERIHDALLLLNKVPPTEVLKKL